MPVRQKAPGAALSDMAGTAAEGYGWVGNLAAYSRAKMATESFQLNPPRPTQETPGPNVSYATA